MKRVIKNIIIKIIGKHRFEQLKKEYSYNFKYPNNIDDLYIISKYLNKKIKNGTMVDVGVHFGESSELFLNNDWKVYGFEPDDNNKNKIPNDILNHKNYTLFDCALSDKIGEMNFYSSEESTGISSLLNFHETHKIAKVVKVETLNNMISKNHINNINMLKIDTEGYDLFVLKGLDILKQDELEIIFCEFEDNKTKKLDYVVQDMINHLMDSGYKVIVSEWHPIIKYGVQHKFNKAEKYPCTISENGWGNLVAYKDEAFEKYFINEIKKRVAIIK